MTARFIARDRDGRADDARARAVRDRIGGRREEWLDHSLEA